MTTTLTGTIPTNTVSDHCARRAIGGESIPRFIFAEGCWDAFLDRLHRGQEQPVQLLLEHDPGRPLASTADRTLTLAATPGVGLTWVARTFKPLPFVPHWASAGDVVLDSIQANFDDEPVDYYQAVDLREISLVREPALACPVRVVNTTPAPAKLPARPADPGPPRDPLGGRLVIPSWRVVPAWLGAIVGG